VPADLRVRQPGGDLPSAVRNAAVRAGRRSTRPDPALLLRVRDALLRLPDNALNQHYCPIPGDCLASARTPWEAP
jgi:hypothetical protein